MHRDKRDVYLLVGKQGGEERGRSSPPFIFINLKAVTKAHFSFVIGFGAEQAASAMDLLLPLCTSGSMR
jgi:hypothetical protein